MKQDWTVLWAQSHQLLSQKKIEMAILDQTKGLTGLLFSWIAARNGHMGKNIRTGKAYSEISFTHFSKKDRDFPFVLFLQQ